MKCALCGYEFSPDEAECTGCAFNKSCKTTCCPHCGYRTVEKSGILDWIKKIVRGEKNVADK